MPLAAAFQAFFCMAPSSLFKGPRAEANRTLALDAKPTCAAVTPYFDGDTRSCQPES
jgi:hypothetical protein